MDLNNLDSITKERIANLEYNNEKPRVDYTGQIFSRLTVLGRGPNYISPSGKKNSQWWCICDCPQHNILLVRVSNLTSGNTKSCGCLNNEARAARIKPIGQSMASDLTNQQFSELTALEPTKERRNGSVVWKCQCSCGKIHYVSAHDLVNNRIHSCGHLTESLGITKIKQILENNNITYSTEKTFNTCKFEDTQAAARFDFYIDNKFLLEYDGEQHFKEMDQNYFTDSLEKRQLHDQYKNNWCKENNIPLKRIPYWQLNEITLESIMGDKFLI